MRVNSLSHTMLRDPPKLTPARKVAAILRAKAGDDEEDYRINFPSKPPKGGELWIEAPPGPVRADLWKKFLEEE